MLFKVNILTGNKKIGKMIILIKLKIENGDILPKLGKTV
tara:strand:+ start:4038 stop:4154 length:117 start_codon:yes stop_codon:yes gene_type:complete